MGKAAAQPGGGTPVRRPSPFALKIFQYSRRGLLSRLSDELATLGVDSHPRRLADPKIRAKGDYEGGLVERRILLESVYDVLGTMCSPCLGLDKHFCRRQDSTLCSWPALVSR
jgi:hypothetical protein